MKNALFSILATVVLLSSCGQSPKTTSLNSEDHSFCGTPPSPTATFASFTNDKAFMAAHPLAPPADTVFKGKMISYPVDGGAAANAYLVTPRKKTNKYLLLFHEWWGLNAYVKNEADFWSKELGVNVIALDLYDGKVAKTPEDAGNFMKGNDENRSKALIKGAITFAGDKADFRTMGWCFGGGWSLKGALVAGNRLKACVMYYGMPEKDVNVLKTLAAPVVFIHPTQDKWITADVTSEFEKNMQSAGKDLKVYHYDADHAFANPSSPRYNDKAAKDARKVVKKFLQSK